MRQSVCIDCKLKEYFFMGAKGNIGNTWKVASELLGFKFIQCCPKGYEIDGASVCYDLEQAVANKDIICTDSIPSAAKDDFKGYQITLEDMKYANKQSYPWNRERIHVAPAKHSSLS